MLERAGGEELRGRRKEGGLQGRGRVRWALDPQVPKCYTGQSMLFHTSCKEGSMQDIFLEDENQFCLEAWPGQDQK